MIGIIFILLANSQGKLWFIECVQLDVQIRPVFRRLGHKLWQLQHVFDTLTQNAIVIK